MLKKIAVFFDRKFLRHTVFINIERPIVYLYRGLQIALPVLLYAIGIAFAASLEVVRYI